LAFTPELYACGVDIVGPSNVKTLFQSFPDYWMPIKKRWIRRTGDVESDENLNRKISPFFHVRKIRVPLLIGHGANDPRVKLEESEKIVRQLRLNQKQVIFVVYSDEGHGFNRFENKLDFYGRMEEFLAKYLRGRCEPWEKIPGTSVQVK
jgi:dipeptidyl aminopeptidase/acylaminoacyl peptidase